jgi:hypothetical protein
MRFIKIPTSKKPHIAFLHNIGQKSMLYFPSKLGSGYQILRREQCDVQPKSRDKEMRMCGHR